MESSRARFHAFHRGDAKVGKTISLYLHKPWPLRLLRHLKNQCLTKAPADNLVCDALVSGGANYSYCIFRDHAPYFRDHLVG